VTYGDHTFRFAASMWNSLPSHVIVAVSPSSALMWIASLISLLSHFVTSLICTVLVQWLILLDTIIAIIFVDIFGIIAIHCLLWSSNSTGTTAYYLSVAEKPGKCILLQACFGFGVWTEQQSHVWGVAATSAGWCVDCFMQVGHLWFR